MTTLQDPTTMSSAVLFTILFGIPMLALAVKCGAIGALVRWAVRS